jgi:D-alanyl-D-alanine carboxypeptidase/D-alanyl-D-alanine-endopeptidase (penicillin-binding protein 4)
VESRVQPVDGPCADWSEGVAREISRNGGGVVTVALSGGYPRACGEKSLYLSLFDNTAHIEAMFRQLWQELGGSFKGRVSGAVAPADVRLLASRESRALAEVVRDINKFSNNVMAQQLFLTLSLQQQGTGTLDGSREILRQWWRDRIGGAGVPTFGNGSGLSRDERVTAQQLARLLQFAWRSPLMPELLSSLPLAGVDGTMRRARGHGVGLAHLKTGSLRDVAGVAGIVHGASGRRYVLVAIANHPQAAAIRPAIEALVDWTARDR